VTTVGTRCCEIPGLVHALYSGQRYNKVIPGTGTGITSANWAPAEAARKTDLLQRDRKDADYGPTAVAEPYTEAQTTSAWIGRRVWSKTLGD
jgi:hypothetical protein